MTGDIDSCGGTGGAAGLGEPLPGPFILAAQIDVQQPPLPRQPVAPHRLPRPSICRPPAVACAL